MNKYILLLFLVITNITGAVCQSEMEIIKKAFLKPGSENKPWVYWFVLDGHISEEGITKDMESMKEAGIGGIIFMEIDIGLEKGPVPFMSDNWLKCFKHAIMEAERLGLEFTVSSGPGWAGSGGPWVKAEESMLHLVSSSVDISGNADLILPMPQPEIPFFGMESLDENMKAAREGFYKDVFVLAYPKTPKLQSFDHYKERALFIRRPYSSDDQALPFIKMPSPADDLYIKTGINSDEMIDVSSCLQPDGRFIWNAPTGEWTVYRFGVRTTGANTRPAPVSGYGFECSKLDSGFLNHHFDHFHNRLIEALGESITGSIRQKGWTMLHLDSWEMGAQNWSYHFADEFKKRRGYDIKQYLPAYAGQIVKSRDITERFLWDMRLTAQEVMIENYATQFRKFAHRNGMGLSIEPYDMNPASDLALGAIADVPMCEYWIHPLLTAFSCTEAVSIAHTNNKRIIGAESMTGGHQSELWKENPAVMKNRVDWALAYGINRMVFHAAMVQPYLDQLPGMTMRGTGTFYNTTQTWWGLSEGWHNYVTRCQYILRQGRPVADILFLNMEGAPVSFSPPVSATSGTNRLPDRKGFNFDGCDPLNLIANADVKNGKIIFPGNMEYSVLVLPNTRYMTPELLKKINALIEKGAVVIGFAPEKSPSLVNYPGCDDEIKALALKMWRNSDAPLKIGKGILYPCSGEDTMHILPAAVFGTGKTLSIPPYIHYNSIEKVLHEIGIIEDFHTDKTFRYTHRKLEEGDIYFVSNTGDAWETGICTFRAKGNAVSLLNPLNGKEFAAEVIAADSVTTTVRLRLEPYGSVFVLFDHDHSKLKLPDMAPELTVVKTMDHPWKVNFKPRFGGPSDTIFNELTDWSASNDINIKYYSGIAGYVSSVTLTKKEIKGRTFLDLGNVEVIAKVKINGMDAGIVWKTPYMTEVSGFFKPGNNLIEIEVANLWANRLIGDQSLPEEEKFTRTTFNPYQKTDTLLPSGLIGPVTVKKPGNMNNRRK